MRTLWPVSHSLLRCVQCSDDRFRDLDVRIEWCKARARAERWAEEVDLLQEEQRRVLISLEERAETWKGRACLRSRVSPNGEHMVPEVDEGLRAYAARQADILTRIKKHFEKLWSPDEDTDDKDDDDEETKENLTCYAANAAVSATTEDYYHIED